MAISHLYPTERPTLNLNFALSKTLDPRLSFTRNTIGTYVGTDGLIKTAAAGEARFDHDPITGESLGLLIEYQFTNLVTYSEDFSNAAWTKDNITVSANQAVAPDGTTTADLIYPSSTGYARTIYQNFNNADATYTVSCFVKAAGKNWVFIYNAQGNAKAWFNLSTGAKGTADGTITDYGIVAYPNGWYRCWVRTDNTTARYIFIGPADGDNSTEATTSGTNGIYVWGAQFEGTASSTTSLRKSRLTSYIPSTGNSSTTRNYDECILEGTNFSAIFPGAGSDATFHYELRAGLGENWPNDPQIYWNFGLGTNQFIYAYQSSSTAINNIIVAGGISSGLGQTVANDDRINGVCSLKSGTTFKSKINDGDLKNYGSSVAAMPACTYLAFGQYNSSYLKSRTSFCISRFAYYPFFMTDDELTGLGT